MPWKKSHDEYSSCVAASLYLPVMFGIAKRFSDLWWSMRNLMAKDGRRPSD